MYSILDNVQFILEIIGTIGFAISGAIVGIQRRMDLLGVTVLGVTTAIGGGIIRDLILGHTPPASFVNPIYFVISAIVSIIAFLPVMQKFALKRRRFSNELYLLCDTIGLSCFTVLGMAAAGDQAEEYTWFLMVFIGVVTGVGGGVVRDVFANHIPGIFTNNFYATASMIGALLTMAFWNPLGKEVAMIIGALTVFNLRFLAAHLDWKLPKAERPKQE